MGVSDGEPQGNGGGPGEKSRTGRRTATSRRAKTRAPLAGDPAETPRPRTETRDAPGGEGPKRRGRREEAKTTADTDTPHAATARGATTNEGPGAEPQAPRPGGRPSGREIKGRRATRRSQAATTAAQRRTPRHPDAEAPGNKGADRGTDARYNLIDLRGRSYGSTEGEERGGAIGPWRKPMAVGSKAEPHGLPGQSRTFDD